MKRKSLLSILFTDLRTACDLKPTSSPTRAYKADESLSGKTIFGFVSKYPKGALGLTRNTAFQFCSDGGQNDPQSIF